MVDNNPAIETSSNVTIKVDPEEDFIDIEDYTYTEIDNKITDTENTYDYTQIDTSSTESPNDITPNEDKNIFGPMIPDENVSTYLYDNGF